MAINFPNSPSVNDIHSEGGIRWKWNGSSWTRSGGSAITDTITTANDNSTTTLYPVMVTGTGSQTAKIATTATKNISFDASDGNLTIGGDVSIGGTVTYEDVRNVDSIGIVTARAGIKVLAGGIDVTGNSEFSAVVDIVGDLAIADTIRHIGDGDTKIRFPSNDTVSVETAGSERLRIDSSGRLMLGTTTPGAAQVDTFTLETSGHTGMTFFSGTSNRGQIAFGDGRSGNAQYRGVIMYDHSDDSMRLVTSDAERLRIDAVGNLSLGRGAASSTQYGRNFQIHDTGTSGATLHLTTSDTGTANSDGFHLVQQGPHIYHWLRETGNQVFATGGTERLRIDSGGRLLLNTTTEGHGNADDLTIATAAGSLGNTGITIRSSTTGDGNIFFSDATSGDGETKGVIKYSHNTDHMQFNIDGSEVLRIDSSGRVIVGGTTHAGGSQFAVMGGNINTYASIALGNKTAAPGNNTTFAMFRFNSGSAGTSRGAEIIAAADANWTAGSSYPTRLVFSTTAASATSSTERLRIAANGQVSISSDGTTDGLLTIKGDSDATTTPSIRLLDGGDTREVSITNQSGDFIASVHGTDNATHGHIKMFESGIFSVATGGASGSNVERLRITSGGSVRIGGSTPVGYSANGNVDDIVLGGTSSHGITILTGNSSTGSLWFSSENGNTGYIQYPHNEEALILGTEGNERLRITSGGNVDINGTPPWSVTGGDYRSLSISGQTASSSGFIWLGNGAAATNADFDLGRINFCNGATITSQIAGSTQTSANDDGRITFSTKATGGSLTERLRITSSGQFHMGGGSSWTYANQKFVVVEPNNNLGMLLQGNNANEGVNLTLQNIVNANNAYSSLSFADDGGQIFGVVRGKVIDKNANTGELQFWTSGSQKLTIDKDGLLGLNVTPSYSGLFGGSQKGMHIGGTTAPFLRITSSTGSQGDLILQAGNSGGDVQMGNLNEAGDIVFWNKPSGGSLTESVRILSAGGIKLSNTSDNHLFEYGNSTVHASAAINIIRYGSGYADIRLASNYGAKVALAGASDNTDEFYLQQDNTKTAYVYNEADKPIVFATNNSPKMRLDEDGVLRIGNTHTQTTSSNTKRIALGGKGSIWGWVSGQINGSINIADNYYWDGANNRAVEAADAAYLALRLGTLRFGTTDSTPSAGGVTGLTEKFRITNNGNVNINGNFTQTTYPVSITTGNVNKKISFGAAAHDDLSNEGAGIFFSRQNDGSSELSGLFSHSNGGFGIATREDMTFHTGGGSTYGAADERLRIESDGKIDLKVAGYEADIYHTGSGDRWPLRLLNSDTTSGNMTGIYFGPCNNVAGAYIAGKAEADFTSTANRDAGLVFGVRLNGTFSEPLRITSGGSVRVGNNSSFSAHSAADDLVVGSTSGSNGMTILTGNATASIFFNDGSGNDGVIQYVHSSSPNQMIINSSGQIEFDAGGSERLQITNTGDLILKNNSGKMIDCRTSATTGNCWISLSKSDGTQKGYFGFGSSSSEQLYIVQQESADITIYNGGASRWYFKTTGAFNSATDGQINVYGGSGHATNDARLYVDKTSNADWGIVSNAATYDYGMYARVGNGASYGIGVYDHSNSTWRFRVSGTGSIFATNTTVASISDQRLKENIVDANSQWDDIKALKFRNFKWKADSGNADGKTYLGLIAQEVEPISPNLVEINAQTKEDIENEVPDPEYKNVKYSIVWMKAVKALQEAQARIETLEAKVAALESS